MGLAGKHSKVKAISTHSARITGPVAYVAESGTQVNIPLGPCLVEQLDEGSINIIWGASGQHCAGLPESAVIVARDKGHLKLLD